MRIACRTGSLLVGVLFWFSFAAVGDESAANSTGGESVDLYDRHLLILNSYNKGYQWTDNEVRAIEDAFAGDREMILHTEYMDTKLINTERHLALLAQLFENKYRHTRFAAIIATDDDALRFLREYREQLFPGTPVVFSGINNFDPAKIAGFGNVTGVNEQADFQANLDLILRLQPAVKKVYVISDQLTAGRLIRSEFDATASDYSGRLQFIHLAEHSMAQILDIVSGLGDDSVVFYLTLFRDVTGQLFSPWESIPRISASATVPVYGQVDYMLGKGILGGMVKNSYYQGRVAAELTQRILTGESADDIPVVMDSPNTFMFDYVQLQRFDIALRELPESRIVINEPETLYYRYKTLIWTVLGVIALLLGFIFVLLFNIRKRKRAQKGLQDILLTMSNFFGTGSLDEVKGELIKMIRRVIFLDRRIDRAEAYSYAGDFNSGFDRSTLVPLSPGVTKASDEGLVRKAIEESSCQVKGHECVALFKSPSLPANVVYMAGDRRFDGMDRDLLEMLTSNVSMAIESLEKSRIQESLETARKIQLSMLPRSFRNTARQYGIDLHATLIAAKEVGGDLYDFFAIDDDHLCFLVGDVSDKGVPAALFMAIVKTLIRSAAERNPDPGTILDKANNELCRDNEESMFVSLFLGILNRRTGEVSFGNGGHNPPYLVRGDGRVESVAMEKGLVLGLMEDRGYQTRQLTLQPGDGILLYTDGVTEAMNVRNEEFGEERLAGLLQVDSGVIAEQLDERVVDAVRNFAIGAPQSDDLTVMFLRFRPTYGEAGRV